MLLDLRIVVLVQKANNGYLGVIEEAEQLIAAVVKQEYYTALLKGSQANKLFKILLLNLHHKTVLTMFVKFSEHLSKHPSRFFI